MFNVIATLLLLTTSMSVKVERFQAPTPIATPFANPIFPFPASVERLISGTVRRTDTRLITPENVF